MNDLGFMRPSKENTTVKYFYENDRYLINGNEIYSADSKLFLNGRKIADLKDFFRIIADSEDIYIVTRKTIFKLNDDKLISVMTFNETINDLIYENGKFHVSLRKNIMNGFKFTYMTVSSNKRIRKIDTAVLNLKNTKYQDYLKNGNLVYKDSENSTSKENY
jgi:hypothetical protein